MPFPGPEPQLADQPLGGKWDWSRYEEFSPYLHNIGGGPTFFEVVWCDVEREQGYREWKLVDRIAKRTIELGYRLALKIRVGTCWATGGRGDFVRGSKGKTESGVPEDMGAYLDFVRAAVKRYVGAGVQQYALENEVNSQSMWAGTPDQLVDLVTEAAAVIRQADPDAVIVDPGISSTAYGAGIASWLLDKRQDAEAVAAYQRYYARRFSTRGEQLPEVRNADDLRRALEGEQAQRNLAYLDAARRLAQSRVVDVRQLHFYEPSENIPQLMSFVRSQIPDGMPVQAWEVGIFDKDADSDDAQRSDDVVKTVALLLAEGVQKIMWLPLAFDPTGRHSEEPRYGLLQPSGEPRAGGRAYLALAQAAQDAEVRPVQTSRFIGVALGHGQSTTLVLWSRSSSSQSLSVPGGLASRPDEQPVKVSGGRVDIGQTPVLVKVLIPADEAMELTT